MDIVLGRKPSGSCRESWRVKLQRRKTNLLQASRNTDNGEENGAICATMFAQLKA